MSADEVREEVQTDQEIVTGGKPHENVDWERMLPGGIGAVALAMFANAILYFIASAIGWMPDSVRIGPPENPLPISLMPVLAFTGFLGVLGLIFFALLARFSGKPIPIFTWVAVAVIVLQTFPTFLIGAPVNMILALNLMHILGGVIIIYGFRKWAGVEG